MIEMPRGELNPPLGLLFNSLIIQQMAYNYRYGRESLVRDFDSTVTRVITTTNPVTRDEVKLYLGIDDDTDDTLIDNIIQQAVSIAENFLDRDILSKERELFYPYLAEDITLLWAPINTSVAIVVQMEGTVTDAYEVLGFDDPVIRLENGVAQDVTIQYTTAALDSASVKQGILALTGHLYPRSDIKLPWKSFLEPFKRMWI